MSQQSSLQIHTPPATAAAAPATVKPGGGAGKLSGLSFVGRSGWRLLHLLPLYGILAGASNLANLLPTGTVLAFQTLIPSFTDGGICLLTHKYLTGTLITLLSATCLFSSFTDSFLDQNGKIYYGIAVPNGLYLFNTDHLNHDEETRKRMQAYLTSYHLMIMDFVRALVSLLMFALSDANVQDCYWPKADPNLKALFMNLPLAGAVFSTFFFSIFPTTRRGIGYADSPRNDPNFYYEELHVLPLAISNPNNK